MGHFSIKCRIEPKNIDFQSHSKSFENVLKLVSTLPCRTLPNKIATIDSPMIVGNPHDVGSKPEKYQIVKW